MIKKRGLGTNRGLDALLGNIAIEKKIIADAQEAVADQTVTYPNYTNRCAK